MTFSDFLKKLLEKKSFVKVYTTYHEINLFRSTALVATSDLRRTGVLASEALVELNVAAAELEEEEGPIDPVDS